MLSKETTWTTGNGFFSNIRYPRALEDPPNCNSLKLTLEWTSRSSYCYRKKKNSVTLVEHSKEDHIQAGGGWAL